MRSKRCSVAEPVSRAKGKSNGGRRRGAVEIKISFREATFLLLQTEKALSRSFSSRLCKMGSEKKTITNKKKKWTTTHKGDKKSSMGAGVRRATLPGFRLREEKKTGEKEPSHTNLGDNRGKVRGRITRTHLFSLASELSCFATQEGALNTTRNAYRHGGGDKTNTGRLL